MPSDEQLLNCELLVVRLERGDTTAFASLVQMWERPLFYYLRRLVTSEAEVWDLLQETWLKVFRSIGTLKDPRTLPAFLYTIARNTAISGMRKGAFEEMHVGPLDGTIDIEVVDNASFENVEQLHCALDQLPLPQREALTLHFLQDLSLEEIAALLAVPRGTVKSRLHYGKLAIRKILSQGDGYV